MVGYKVHNARVGSVLSETHLLFGLKVKESLTEVFGVVL